MHAPSWVSYTSKDNLHWFETFHCIDEELRGRELEHLHTPGLISVNYVVVVDASLKKLLAYLPLE